MELNLNIGSFESSDSYKKFKTDELYDILIIGGGPAGLTAAVYCMRKGLNTGIIIKKVGGQVAETAGIENYMGYRYVDGTELTDKFKTQVTQFGITYEEDEEVVKLTPGKIKKVTVSDGREFIAKSVIIATGKRWKKLNVPGEDLLVGKGVAYCAICDAPLFKDKVVYVAGGGNSGVEATIDLAPIAKHVTLVHIHEELKADEILQRKMNEFDNVEVMLKHQIIEILGKNDVTGVKIKNLSNNKDYDFKADGVFVEIGMLANSDFLKDVLQLNLFGEIIADRKCKTSEDGIFSAGDVTNVPFKQIIIAAGEGSNAALSAHEYILQNEF
jgi:alkyl hydroperoxide reductase subunit F